MSHQFFSRAAFSGNQYRSPRVLQARNHAKDILNIRRGADDSVEVLLGAYALAEKLVFGDQLDFFGHALQEKTHFLDAKGLFDIVVGAKLHGVDR